MPMSPQELAAKWARNFGGSTEAYKAGVQRTTGAPAQKAIAAQDRLLSGFVEAVQSGRWAAALGQVSEAQWKQACVEKGAPAIMAAARLAEAKVARKEAVMGPIRESIRQSLPARGDIQQNLERARLMALRMHEQAARA